MCPKEGVYRTVVWTEESAATLPTLEELEENVPIRSLSTNYIDPL